MVPRVQPFIVCLLVRLSIAIFADEILEILERIYFHYFEAGIMPLIMHAFFWE
jgi:hypothetical protein